MKILFNAVVAAGPVTIGIASIIASAEQGGNAALSVFGVCFIIVGAFIFTRVPDQTTTT